MESDYDFSVPDRGHLYGSRGDHVRAQKLSGPLVCVELVDVVSSHCHGIHGKLGELLGGQRVQCERYFIHGARYATKHRDLCVGQCSRS